MAEWMLYGANGYTGRLIIEECRRRGHRPILAGRNAEALSAMAREGDLPVRAFDLAEARTVAAALSGVSLVLHCAGPFSTTSAPMLEGCLAARAHYLDITGEIDVFAHAHAQDARGRERGVLIIPGTGFDVVPTDAVAAQLAGLLPGARELVLAFDAAGGVSPGTAKSGVEGLAKGGRVRRGGVLERVPLGYKTRSFDRDGSPRSAVTIPWGDVYTAYVSTKIPDIEVYVTMPPATIARLRRMRHFAPLLGLGPVQRFLKARAAARPGPNSERREKSPMRIWGEARDAAGTLARAQLETPNGYDLTVTAALGIVERVLRGEVPAGFHTPSQLMGAGYVETLPGVRWVERPRIVEAGAAPPSR